MNPLNDYPEIRKWVYVVFWVVGLGLSGWQVGIGTIPGAHNPTVLNVALGVYAFLGTAIGFTAASNTPARLRQRVPVEQVPHRPDAGA